MQFLDHVLVILGHVTVGPCGSMHIRNILYASSDSKYSVMVADCVVPQVKVAGGLYLVM